MTAVTLFDAAVAALIIGLAVASVALRDAFAAVVAFVAYGVALADEYAARINDRITPFQRANDDHGARLASQAWRVSQATGAFKIAAGPFIHLED